MNKIQSMYESALQLLAVAYTANEITEAYERAIDSINPQDKPHSMTFLSINEDALLDKFLKELILLTVRDLALNTANREYLITTIFSLYEAQYS